MSKWVIYSLQNTLDGPVFYVGYTANLKRRRKEHYPRFGKGIIMTPIETADSLETAMGLERKWITHYWASGECAENIAEGKRHTVATRRKISLQQKGRPKPVGHGQKVSAALKGLPHNWTEEGRRKSEAAQFKPGERRFADLPVEMQEHLRECRKHTWEGISPEERSRMARERNLAAWAKRTPEQRKAIGDRIREGKLERFSAEGIKTRAALATSKASEAWAKRSPEEKAEIIARRNATAKAKRDMRAKTASV